VSARYLIRPKADQDLEDQAYYLSTQATPEVGHRFLAAAHEHSPCWLLNPEWVLRFVCRGTI